MDLQLKRDEEAWGVIKVRNLIKKFKNIKLLAYRSCKSLAVATSLKASVRDEKGCCPMIKDGSTAQRFPAT